MIGAPVPENLPGASSTPDTIDDIDAEIQRIQSLTKAGNSSEGVNIEQPGTPAPGNLFKADYEHRLSVKTTSSASGTKPQSDPFPIKPKGGEGEERVIPTPLSKEPTPALRAEQSTLSEKQEAYQRFKKEAELAQRRAGIAKKRADLAAEELELEKLEAA